MDKSTENRVQNLEELCAHQASEIDTLSETVREQWDQIDALKKALLRFRDRLTELEESSGGHENTPPPHY